MVDNQRYSLGASGPNSLGTTTNGVGHHPQGGLNPAKSQANIGNSHHNGSGVQASNTGPINSKSIDAAAMKQTNRRLVSSGQKNMR